MEDERIEAAIVEEPEEAPKSSWVLVGQFFIVPVIIVAICVGIFLLFGLITQDTRNARDYLEEIKAGKGSRWQAAFELSKYISAKASQRDPRLAQDISAALQKAKDDDPRVRQYLALALGKMQDTVAVDPLIDALDDNNPDVRLYVVWALGRLGDQRAVEPLLKRVEDSDPALRKMIIYTLGMLQDPRALPPLKAALNNPHADLRWNAALALARLHDTSGLDVLHQMLDRKYLDSLAEVNDDQKSDAIINATHGVALLKDHSSRPVLQTLSYSDPVVKVREAALEALKQIP